MDWQTMQKVACNLLYDQARYLDERQWDQWLALYCDDCRYWVPAWKNELEATNDPQNEVSFIFMITAPDLKIASGASAQGSRLHLCLCHAQRTWLATSRLKQCQKAYPRLQRSSLMFIIATEGNKSSFSGVMNTCWYKKGLTGKFSSVKLIYTTTTFQRCWTFIAFDA